MLLASFEEKGTRTQTQAHGETHGGQRARRKTLRLGRWGLPGKPREESVRHRPEGRKRKRPSGPGVGKSRERRELWPRLAGRKRHRLFAERPGVSCEVTRKAAPRQASTQEQREGLGQACSP